MKSKFEMVHKLLN